jgi:hypothetical protein
VIATNYTRIRSALPANYYSVELIREWDGKGTWHVWETGEVFTGFWWATLRERNHLEDLGVDREIILKYSSRSEV